MAIAIAVLIQPKIQLCHQGLILRELSEVHKFATIFMILYHLAKFNAFLKSSDKPLIAFLAILITSEMVLICPF